MRKHVYFLPVKEFFDRCGPNGNDLSPENVVQGRERVVGKISKVKHEMEMNTILRTAFARILENTKHVVVDTAEDVKDEDEDIDAEDVEDENENEDLKPALTMYSKDIGAEAWNLKHAEGPTAHGDRWAYRGAGHVAWFFAVMFMEVVLSSKHDPFQGSVLNETEQGRATFSHMTDIAAESLSLQHRAFLFTAVVVKTKARLLRWDRAGVVVSDEFDINAEPEWLFNFVYRVATSGREAQGFDPTVTDADEDQIKQLDDYIKKQGNVYAKEYLEKMNEDRTLYPIQQVQCDVFEFAKTKIERDPQYSVLRGKEQVTLLIGKSCFADSSLAGRGTKGFVAFVVDGDRLVFLKESWRSTDGFYRAEGDIYRDLTTADVCNIPFAFAGGNTSDSHVTHNDELLKAGKRQQYRLVLWDVGVPLDRHAASYELAYALYGALSAHQAAWKKAGILHRDISPGNVLIDILSPTDSSRGLLCDWELSQKKSELGEDSTHRDRSGTWITLSAVSLKYPYKPIGLADDLESFYHLLAHNVLRFYRHSMTISHLPQRGQVLDSALARFVWEYFRCRTSGRGGHPDTGGQMKWDQLRAPNPPFYLLHEKSALSTLLGKVHELCYMHYLTVDERDLAQYRPARAVSPPDLTPPEQSIIPRPRPPPPSIAAVSWQRPATMPPTTSRAFGPSPLLNHDAMLIVFYDLMTHPETGPAPIWPKNDKIDDQFVGLPIYGFVFDKEGSSGRTKTVARGRSRRKRSRTPDSGDADGQGEGDPKKPRLDNALAAIHIYE